ncbi:MAG: amidohydrolase family protein, partial [Acidobacteriota bacterium]
SGMAWDMQPRYSPDGREIAFTSDRGGGDNIWVMPADGDGDARAVTDENFRLLNNPAWSPDGRFIAARKHFSSRRSLGSGEIWLYHASGDGGGLQLNEKPNEQKDLGEPAFSRDGEFVYFSQDTTPGQQFLYNKDPNGEIYTIRRIELSTGDIESVVTGAGGAVRPTPSPDGQYLAFVRRVRYESHLFVHDLESGEERRIYGPLERDMQETWAVHGVYSNFAWTPDSGSIVLWAGGGLHRVTLADGEVQPIPFKVKQRIQLTETLRFKNDPAPARFDVKMLRWVRTSPDGGQVAFQALGKLWLKDLPDGEPRRVTGQEEHFELYPSWTRDGASLVYVSWHDGDLGAVRVVDVASGESRTLTEQPGHWLEPVASPDGRHVVARKTTGGFITSPLWSKEPGLYALAMDGGEPELITESGVRPHFAVDSDRVYYTTFEAEDGRALRSIGLDGHDPYHHADSGAATEWQVSPDGRWLAFAERFHAYVLPFTASAKPLQLGPGFSALPKAKVTTSAGENLHFAGDSASLHWSLGAELFSRPLTDAFAFLDGAPEELPEPPTEGRQIGFSHPHERAEGTIALVGGRVVTMRGDEVIEDGTVLVEGDRIVAVGPRAEVAVPASARVIELDGKTVIPGLVDAHWHGSQGTQEVQPQQNWYNYATLAFGITTVHDPSNDTSTFFSAAELQKAGLITAPRLFSTGTILYGAAGDFKAQIDSLDDARFHLERMKAVGAFSVKSYNQPRRDQRQQVVAAARELEMLVMPEGGSLFMHNMTMVVDGHTGIEHSIPVPAVYRDVVGVWSATETGYTPTLGIAYGGVWGENYWYAESDVWANERLMSFVPREFVDPVARRPFKAPIEEYGHFKSAAVAAALHDAGVEVYVGAHGQREGLAAHWEMWMFEQGGLTAHEALRAGTLDGAKYLGMEDSIGSIEEGADGGQVTDHGRSAVSKKNGKRERSSGAIWSRVDAS